MTTTWYEDLGGGTFRLRLAIQPGARKSEIIGLHGDALKMKIAAPPVDGSANEALLTFLAEHLQIKRRQLELRSGSTSRRKVIEVQGVSLENVQKLIAAC